MATIIHEPDEPQTAKRPSVYRAGRSIWHRSAPKSFASVCQPGEPGAGWDRWVRHLATRKAPKWPQLLSRTSSCPWTWNLPDEMAAATPASWIHPFWELRKAPKKPESPRGWEKKLDRWLDESAVRPGWQASAVSALAIAAALPQLASHVPAKLWWDTLDRLLDWSAPDAATQQLDENPLAAQLLGGELPLLLGCLFPEIRLCRNLLSGARRALSDGLIDLLDGEGMPHAKHLSSMRPLLACWTRCLAVGDGMDASACTPTARLQYEWLVRQTLRWTSQDGRQLLTPGASAARCDDLLQCALAIGGDRSDQAAASLTLSARKSGPHVAARARRAPPAPSLHSEWSEVAVLRPDWSSACERLAVAYETSDLKLQFDCGRDTVLSGVWQFEIKVGGKPCRPQGDWDQLCWVSDDDVDYLELEMDLESGVRLQRQLLLAREDRFLFLADAVLGLPADRAEYRGTLPLGPGISLQAEKETRELRLAGTSARGLVMPLALSEWQADPRDGALQDAAGHIELSQDTTGRNLYCPLMFDLNPRRANRNLTWRRLTVAERLRIVPQEVAVGYRAQCGRDQWLFYRSLDTTVSRTVLGHNLTSEFLAARFLRGGMVEELLEIE